MTDQTSDVLSDDDYEALANLRYTLRQFMDFSASAASAEGVPAQQHQALLAIKGYRGDGPMAVGTLSERLLIAPHTATELVGRLVKAGYVVRQTDTNDKRRQTLGLTEKAEVLLRRLTAIHLIEIRDMAPQLMEMLARFNDGGRG